MRARDVRFNVRRVFSGWWVVGLLLLAVGQLEAADWSQFRGPRRNGISQETDLLRIWDGGRPHVVWRREIGGGYSAVSVVGERLFTMDADSDGERVLCLDRDTGAEVWRVPAGPFVQAELGDGGPRSTPTVADDVVYAVSSQSHLLALRVEDGSTVWKRELAELGPVPRFGYSMSPLVDGDLLIVDAGPKEGGPGLYALDRRSGEIRWSALQGPATYSSPIVAEIDDVHQLILFRAIGREVVGLTLSGQVLWRHATPDALAPLASPIFVPPSSVFISTAEDAFGGRMLRIKRSPEGFIAHEEWRERLMRNHFNNSVVVGGYLYGFDNGTLRCLDAESGEQQWAKRSFGKGSLIAADSLLFVLSDAGLAALVEASPDGYQEQGRLQVMEGRSWTAPSLAQARLYLRDFDEIVSLDVGGGWQATGGSR